MRALRLLAVALAAFALAACRANPGPPPRRPPSPIASTSPGAPMHPATPARPPNPAGPPRFHGTIDPLPPTLVRQMRGTTWRPGCPVPLGSLRLLTLRYWNFHHHVRTGPLVINASQARPVLSVFRKLFRARFPIQKLHLSEEYVPSKSSPYDTTDWTAGFNCRVTVTALGPGTHWSQHAYGLAIDVNPMQNPYVTAKGYVYDVYARRYRDRAQHLEGMIHPGGVVVRAFESIGWHWGGAWSGDRDYMHFSLTGT